MRRDRDRMEDRLPGLELPPVPDNDADRRDIVQLVRDMMANSAEDGTTNQEEADYFYDKGTYRESAQNAEGAISLARSYGEHPSLTRRLVVNAIPRLLRWSMDERSVMLKVLAEISEDGTETPVDVPAGETDRWERVFGRIWSGTTSATSGETSYCMGGLAFNTPLSRADSGRWRLRAGQLLRDRPAC